MSLYWNLINIIMRNEYCPKEDINLSSDSWKFLSWRSKTLNKTFNNWPHTAARSNVYLARPRPRPVRKKHLRWTPIQRGLIIDQEIVRQLEFAPSKEGNYPLWVMHKAALISLSAVSKKCAAGENLSGHVVQPRTAISQCVCEEHLAYLMCLKWQVEERRGGEEKERRGYLN